jgi:hypothetical protein
MLASLLPLAAALVPLRSHGGRSSSPRHLAPRDVLEAEFDRLAQGRPVVVVDDAAAAPLLAELLAAGDLGDDELRAMWGPGARDRPGFVALCEAVEDLFEEEDDEAPAAVAAPVAAPAAVAAPAYVDAISDPRFDAPAASRDGSVDNFAGRATDRTRAELTFSLIDEEQKAAPVVEIQSQTPVAALLQALPAGCTFPNPEDPEAPTYRELTALCKEASSVRDEALRSDLELVDLLTGTWELAYTSSPSFAFNKGFTGVAGTLPGGAEFVSLKQTISDSVDAVVYVETIAPKIGVDSLDVTVASDWGLARRFDALSRCNRVYVDCLPRKVTYGPVTVDGKRVERGWKSMRVMNALAVEYIDDEVRVMQGTTAYFVFRKVT